MRILFAFILLVLMQNATAQKQQWYELRNNRNVKFNDIRKAYLKEESEKKKEQEWDDDEEEKFKRWEAFWHNRVDASGKLLRLDVQDSITKTLRSEAAVKYKMLGGPPAPVTTVSSSWQSLGPSNTQDGYSGIGRINCMGFHPTNPAIFYAGTNGGGLWKTTDGGNNWLPLTDKLGPFTVASIQVSKTNPDIIYFSAEGTEGGLWKTNDGGVTWAHIKNDGGAPNSRVLINPSNTNDIIYKSGTIYRSIDGGASFTSSGLAVYDIERNPQNPNILYGVAASTASYPVRLYRSMDGGTIWTLVQSFMPGGGFPKLAVSPAQPNLVEFVVSNDSGGLRGLYRSRDNGLTYAAYFMAGDTTNYLGYDAQPKTYTGQAGWGILFALDPNDPAIKYLGGVNTWKTIDDGKTWKIKNFWYGGGAGDSVATVHADKHNMYFHPLNSNSIYETNDGGIYLSTDSGRTWQNKTNTMAISEIYSITAPPPTLPGGSLITGLQDNGTKLRNGNGNWSDIGGGDGMLAQIDYSDPSTIYTSFQYGDVSRLKYQNGHLLSRTTISEKITGGKPPGPWTVCYQLNPKNPNNILIGYKDLYQSYNQGDSWTKITTNILGGSDIEYLQIAQSDTNTIVASNHTKIVKSVDGGRNWIDIGKNIPVSSVFITSVCIHPKNPLKLWAVNSFNAGKTVYRSTDGGTTWTNISYDLNIYSYFSRIVVADGTPGDDVYLISDLGVCYSNNIMNSWTAFDTGLPKCYKSDATIDYTTNSLLIGTYGRGVWSTPLQNAPVFKGGTCSVSNNDGGFKGGDTAFIRYTFNRHYFRINGNRFRVQLSDTSGNFGSPTELGFKEFYLGDHGFNIVVPSSLACGGNYKIRVVADLPADTTSTSPFTTAPPPGTPVITATRPLTFCQGDSVVLSTGGTGLTYQWYRDTSAIGNAVGSCYTATQTGNYSVRIKGSLDCSAFSAAVAVNTKALPAKPVITKNTLNDLVSSSVNGNQWFSDTSVIAGASAQHYHPVTSGNFKVQVVDKGCNSPFSEVFYYAITAINPVSAADNEYKVLPNPVKDQLFIQAGSNAGISLQLIDLSGRMLIVNRVFQKNTKIDMQRYPAGNYYLLLTDMNTKAKSQKIIIKE